MVDWDSITVSKLLSECMCMIMTFMRMHTFVFVCIYTYHWSMHWPVHTESVHVFSSMLAYM